ncbi:hypothetical protein DsansV1_C01g0006091 [Dioscorea sansibarensis]
MAILFISTENQHKCVKKQRKYNLLVHNHLFNVINTSYKNSICFKIGTMTLNFRTCQLGWLTKGCKTMALL